MEDQKAPPKSPRAIIDQMKTCVVSRLPPTSTNKPAARQFINFLNRPEVAARNAQYVYYATPNQAAERLLPAEHLENPVIYPSAQVIGRSETYRELAPRAQKTVNEVFANLLR